MVCVAQKICSNTTAACFGGHAPCVALLLTHGANPLLKNQAGLTARMDVKGGEVMEVFKVWDHSKQHLAISKLWSSFPAMFVLMNSSPHFLSKPTCTKPSTLSVKALVESLVSVCNSPFQDEATLDSGYYDFCPSNILALTGVLSKLWQVLAFDSSKVNRWRIYVD